MNKPLKYVLLAAGGTAAVLIVLAVYLAATFDPNDYKPQIVRMVKQKFDRTLKIDGDIKLTFYPALGADLGKVSLSEHASEKEFAAVEEARVSLRLIPLLSRKLVVSQIEVRGLRARVIRHKDGSTNLSDMTATGEDTPKSPAADASVQTPIQFNIAHVLIQDASLSYTDEGSNATYTLNKLTLRTGKIATATSSDIDLAFIFDATRPHVNADVHLKTRLTLGQDGRSFKLDALNLSIKGDAAGMNPLVLDLKGSAEGSAKSLKSNELVLEFDGRQGDHTIKGRLTSPLTVDLETQTVDLDKLTASFRLSDPKSERTPLNVDIQGSAHADLPRQRAHLDFSTKFDASRVTGKVGLTHFSPPSYIFDVTVDKLDTHRFVAAKKPGEDHAASDDKSEQSLDLSFLKTLSASGSVKIGALQVGNLKMQNVRVYLKAGDGRLDLNPLSAGLYQGTMKGSVSLVAAATPRLDVKQQLIGIRIGSLLKDVIDEDILEGRGNVTLDVSGRGVSMSAIEKALNGSAAIHIVDGALKGINIAETIRNAKARLDTLRGATTQPSNIAGKTDFTELKASFAIKNGIAHNSDLSLKSPLLRVGGAGDINIGRRSMDYLAKATLVATTVGQGGKNVSELRGITVPVRIYGPFASLSYKLDIDALVRDTVQQKVEQRKEELESKVRTKLKDQLKGLFGR